jgi:hypothetical protein
VMSSLSQTSITRFSQPLMQVRYALHCSSPNEHGKHSVFFSDSFSVFNCFHASVPGWLADHPDASSWAPRGVLTAKPCTYLRSELRKSFAESSKPPEASTTVRFHWSPHRRTGNSPQMIDNSVHKLFQHPNYLFLTQFLIIILSYFTGSLAPHLF